MDERPRTERSLEEVSDGAWQALASRRVFFGHQSVGENIMDGVRRTLEARPEIPLRVITTEHPERVDGPALMEARIGENRHPESKSEAFGDVLDRGFGDERGAIALYKYCYVDVGPETDADRLFASYARHADAMRERYPELTLAHVTMPLRTAPTGVWERIKAALGAETETGLNRLRTRFNERLRERYIGEEPLFDLALIESTRADGSRATSRYRGEEIPMLAPEWTHDGGHLNEEGRVRVAEQLLVFLADAATSTTPSAERAAPVVR